MKSDLRKLAEAKAGRSPDIPESLSPDEIRATLHELQVHQIELEMQNEELRSAQAEIETGRARFFDLYDLAPVGYITLSEKGLILEANLTAATLLGTARGVLVKQPISHFIIKDDQDIYYLHRKKLFETGESQECELRMVRPDGANFWAHLTATTARTEDGAPVCRMTFSDISERKQAEIALLEREDELRSIASSIPGAIYQFVRRVDGTFEIPFMSEGARLLFGRPVAELQDTSRLFDDVHPEDVPGLWASIEASEKNLTPWSTEFRLVPKTAPLRWLCGASNPRRMPDGGTSWYGVLLDITEQKRREEQTRLQHTLALALAAASDLQQGLRLCLQTALQGTGLDAGGFYLVEENSGALDFLVPHGLSSEFVQAVSRYEAASDHTRLVMAGSPIFARLEDMGLILSEAERREGLRSTASIPLHYAGKVIGAMNVASHSVDDIPPAIRQLLETIAATATQAIVRLRAQERLRASEERFRSYVEHSPYGAFVVDGQGRYVDVNPAAVRITGYSAGQLTTMRISDLLPAESQEAGLRHFQTLVETGESVGDTAFRRADGSVGHWMVSATRLGPNSYLGFVEDITERKEREARMALLVRMLDDAPAAITIHDDEGRFLFSNRQSVRLHGYDSEKEFLSVNLHELDVRESESLLAERFRQIAERGEARFEVAHYRRDGSTFPLEVTARAIEWQGRPAVLSIASDITERKRAEQALRQSEERFRAANEASLDCILMLRSERDGNGEICDFVIVDLNQRSEAMLRMGRERLLGKRLCEVLPINREAGFFEKYKRVVDTGIPLEEEFFLPETHVPAAWYYHQVVRVGDGIFICHRDIGERKRAEEEQKRLQAQFVQAQKMESVGRLAGGVAHDFNNMIMGIMGCAELCQDAIGADHPAREWLDEILREAQRSANLTRQLLAFARKQTVAPQMLDLNDAVANMLKMLRRLMGEDIDLSWQPGAELKSVKIDPGQVDQLLANLCVNARDAIHGVGQVTIKTKNVSIDTDYCAEHAEATPGPYVMLVVSDNGCGMDKETLERIFEPFYTTKGVGKGTGLGLATVYGILKQNGGFVDVYSEPGEGTTFRIYLPQFGREQGKQEEVETTEKRPGGSETVMVVEDEKSVRVTMRLFLEELGYTVWAAESPERALQLAAEHPAGIALLITDVVMPGLNGRELAGKLIETHPELKVLYMSGYTADVIAHRGVLEADVQFVSKPINRDDLARKVREVLDGQ